MPQGEYCDILPEVEALQAAAATLPNIKKGFSKPEGGA